MTAEALAQRLAAGETLPRACLDAPPAEREALGWALKAACHEAWSSAPARVPVLASALAALAQGAPTPLLQALAAWTDGLARIVDGHMEPALAALDDAQARLVALGRPGEAAQTQVPKLIALALLGRHDEAAACAEAALDAFDAAGDSRSAGKVELNLASMRLRQERYADAERHYRAAALRFARLGDTEHAVMADIGLATALSWQFRFDEAAAMLDHARRRADAHTLPVLSALARGNLGTLELHRGRHAQALHELEASARQLAGGVAPQRHAEAERALADAYLTLNLWPEAQALLQRVVETARAVDAPVEQARAEVDLALALARQARSADAVTLLAAARQRFAAQGNVVGVALADWRRAALALEDGDAAAAQAGAERAAAVFGDAGVRGWRLDALRLAAAARLQQGADAEFGAHLADLQADAEAIALPAAQAAIATLRGQWHERRGETDAAREAYQQAVAWTDGQRVALRGDELRTGFGADKQLPYDALVRLAAADVQAGVPGAAERLLQAIERGRARSLALARHEPGGATVGDSATGPAMRTRLNWIYHQWQHALADGELARAADYEAQAVAAERDWAEAGRRQRLALAPEATPPTAAAAAAVLDVGRLQQRLPADTALVAWHVDAARWHAVVVHARGVHAAGGDATGLDAALAQARFQIDALRYGRRPRPEHAAQLLARARLRLQALYRLLFEPLETVLADCRRLVLLPHRQLHDVPFAALHDGRQWLVERFDLQLAPSAAWWLEAHEQPAAALQHALVVGHGAGLPRIADEVAAVAAAWGQAAQVRLGEQATVGEVITHAAGVDLLHLACHARFRADNPAFSALALADGALTMADVAALALRPGVVVLSACDTALARVAAGDELIGLVRGFLIAGAASVVASLWTVDDTATAELMADFGRHLRDGQTPSAALCAAQRALAARQPHPSAWAAFAVHGRG